MELDDDALKAHSGKQWLDSKSLLDNLSAALWVDHGMREVSPRTLEHNIKVFNDLGFTVDDESTGPSGNVSE